MMDDRNLARTVCYYRAALSRELVAKDKRVRAGNVLLMALKERGVKSLTIGNERISRKPYFYALSPTRRRWHRAHGSTGTPERLEVNRG